MNRDRLYEEKLPRKFTVILSPKTIREMEEIYRLNSNKVNELYQWYSYIDDVQNYVSNRAVAWNYNGRNIRFPNGALFIKDFDYNVGYTIKTNKYTEQTYVYVFMMNLKTEEFGLKRPPVIQESKKKRQIVIKESQLHSIIHKTIRRLLLRA